MWGQNFQIITPKGQSPLAAAVEYGTKFMEQKAQEKNARDLASVKNFQTENADLYGDDYGAKLEAFRNDPNNATAIKRYGNALPSEKRESAEEQLKRLRSEYNLDTIQQGADPNSGWEAQVRRRFALGDRVLKSEIEQYIAEDKNLSEEQKRGLRVKWGVEQSANNAANNAARIQAAQISADVRMDIADMMKLQKEAALSWDKEKFAATIAEKKRQFNKRIESAVGRLHPLDRAAGQAIISEITKLNADLIDVENRMRGVQQKDGSYEAPERGGGDAKTLQAEQSTIIVKLYMAQAKLDALYQKTGGQGAPPSEYLGDTFGGFGDWGRNE